MADTRLTPDDLTALLELAIESYQLAMLASVRQLYIEQVQAQERAEGAIRRVIDAIQQRGL